MTRVFSSLEGFGLQTEHTSEPVESFEKFDLVVSFGYQHLISREALESANGPVINLHISYLPYNRGKHPIFWAFYDDTPLGVSIHNIEQGLDTGPILARQQTVLDPHQVTFRQAHKQMKEQIEELFDIVLVDLMGGEVEPVRQEFLLPAHRGDELPQTFGGWDQIIAPEIQRLKNQPNGGATDRLRENLED